MTSLSIGCDKKIIKVYVPGTMLSPGGIRANSIQLRLGGPNCCGVSNIISISIPQPPPPPPPPTPNKCLDRNIDLYGYKAIVSYDPVNCQAGHSCNAAIFDLYINNILIGQADLNNAVDGGYRETILTINNHIITDQNTSVELRCALSSCHQGIGRITIKDPSNNNNTIFASCLPNDNIVGIGVLPCSPTPTPTITPTVTPTQTNCPLSASISLNGYFSFNNIDYYAFEFITANCYANKPDFYTIQIGSDTTVGPWTSVTDGMNPDTFNIINNMSMNTILNNRFFYIPVSMIPDPYVIRLFNNITNETYFQWGNVP